MERECRNCGELRNKFICDICKKRRLEKQLSLEKDGGKSAIMGKDCICSSCGQLGDSCDTCGNDFTFGRVIVCWKGLHFCNVDCRDEFKKLVLKEKEVAI